MNQVATIERPVKSVLVDMSNRYGMEPAAFEATVRATCMKPDKNGRVPSREEFAAFLLVAKEYTLNPLTKEIYAFAAKGGGIVPIVSVDGWVNLINSHGQLDGIEFDMTHNDKDALVSCTCRIYRKDRSKPVEVTEYLSECVRDTEPWKMKHRMLRHKALVQCARYAFGFSGIYDEDEGEKIAEMRDVTPTRDEPPPPPPPPAARAPLPTDGLTGEKYTAIHQGKPITEWPNIDPISSGPITIEGEIITAHGEVLPAAPDPVKDLEAFKTFCIELFDAAETAEDLNARWEQYVTPVEASLFPPDEEDLMGAYRKRERVLS